MQKKDLQAMIAVNRFGLGARPGEFQAALPDPRGWLLEQLVSPKFDAGIGSTPSAFQAFQQLNEMKKQRKKTESTKADKKGRKANPVRSLHMQLLHDGIKQSINTTTPFSIRLLDFFSNHFSVSAVNNPMRALSPLLEREAIAPKLYGQFEDMLIAVEQHPAMILYLNNEKSIGPQSRMARRKKVGLNENLAREILELHTLGVDGGYDLKDIQELAMAISGWSVSRPKRESTVGFIYREAGHQPGVRTVVGKRYAQKGISQGESILRDLARHPSTAKFVSFKLAQHLISDQPPEALVSAMTKTWLATDGNIKAVISTLIGHDSAWQPTLQKFKTPREFVVSSIRACDMGTRGRGIRQLVNTLAVMGQRPFNAGSPAGYSALGDAWSGSDALMKRIDWVSRLSLYVKRDPKHIAGQVFGEQLSDNTAQAMARAESRRQSLALLLLSPEFQRR